MLLWIYGIIDTSQRMKEGGYMPDINRIINDIENLSKITADADGGITRIGFTPEYRRGVEYFTEQMKAAGLKVREDSIGNIYGRLPGKDDSLPAIVSGSHLDTVINAGAYDGIAGAVCALEAARMLQENNVVLDHPFEVMGLIEEEGTRFGQVLTGSKFVTGKFSTPDLVKISDENGIKLGDVLSKYAAKNSCECFRPKEDIHAFLELHDEQGPYLENGNMDIGIVENIVAISWLTVTVDGFAGHAGTVPMPLRQDAMTAASHIISAISEYTTEKYAYEATATVGKIELQPNASNCIPSKCTFTVDLRAGSLDIIDDITAHIRSTCKDAEEKYDVRTDVAVGSYQPQVAMDSRLQDVYESNCRKLGYSSCRMNSGAGHDSMIFADYVPTAMFFVPCRKGISHNPEEYVTPEALAKGTKLLYESIIEIDKMDLNKGE